MLRFRQITIIHRSTELKYFIKLSFHYPTNIVLREKVTMNQKLTHEDIRNRFLNSFLLSLICRRERIVLGSNFQNGDFDGNLHFDTR